MPATISTKPWAPASTTPALRSTSSWWVVSASALRAASRPPPSRLGKSIFGMWPSCSRSLEANAATTDRMVPSRGSESASLAYSEPTATARAKASGVMRGTSTAASLTPWKNWASIAPELPRAPSSMASATRMSTRLAGSSSAPCSAPRTADSVSARLVPVSPSATGNTLMRFSRSWFTSTRCTPALSARLRCLPSRYSTAAASPAPFTPVLPVLFARQQEAAAVVLEHDAVLDDGCHPRSFGEVVALPVFHCVHVDEAAPGLLAPDVDVQVQVGQAGIAPHPELVQGGQRQRLFLAARAGSGA